MVVAYWPAPTAWLSSISRIISGSFTVAMIIAAMMRYSPISIIRKPPSRRCRRAALRNRSFGMDERKMEVALVELWRGARPHHRRLQTAQRSTARRTQVVTAP